MFFLILKSNTSLLADKQMTKLQNRAGQSQCSSGNSYGTPCPRLTDERATKRLISKKKEMFPGIHNFRDTNCTHIP